MILVLTTLPERFAAEALARELLEARLAACIHVGATLRSLYHWRGEIETAEETQLVIKTRDALYPPLEAAILARHPRSLPRARRSRNPSPGPSPTWLERGARTLRFSQTHLRNPSPCLPRGGPGVGVNE
jgi:periplasmic divalent cation tolerance protein